MYTHPHDVLMISTNGIYLTLSLMTATNILAILKPAVANFQRHVSPWRVIGRVCVQKPTLLMTDFVHSPMHIANNY